MCGWIGAAASIHRIKGERGIVGRGEEGGGGDSGKFFVDLVCQKTNACQGIWPSPST